jgi:uncharacterized membrane protein YkvA (DUF1232 family)
MGKAMSSSHHALFQQLEKITCAELQSSQRLIELIKEKLNLLDAGDFGHEQAGGIATVFIELLKDTLEDRYQALSIRAFAHICVALDYFLDPDDAISDSVQGGLVDDMIFLQKTYNRFKLEIEKYKRWKDRQERGR